MKIGKVYKIICSQSNDVYIGSTFNTLRDRWKSHKGNYNKWLNDEYSRIAIYPYFNKYGIDNFKIILIKEYEVVDRTHLEAYEQLWINKLKCVNIQSAFRISYLSNKKYNEENKYKIRERRKKYREINKDKIAKYREENKEQITKYREENKDKKKEKDKKYYELNKTKLNENRKEKKKCEVCDCLVRKHEINRHEKTKKHQNSLNNSIMTDTVL